MKFFTSIKGFDKTAFTYKTLQGFRGRVNKARDIVKHVENNPGFNSANSAAGQISDLKIRTRKTIQSNEDWEKMNRMFDPLKQRVVKIRDMHYNKGNTIVKPTKIISENLKKTGKFVHLAKPSHIKIPDSFMKKLDKGTIKGKNVSKQIKNKTKKLINKT